MRILNIDYEFTCKFKDLPAGATFNYLETNTICLVLNNDEAVAVDLETNELIKVPLDAVVERINLIAMWKR